MSDNNHNNEATQDRLEEILTDVHEVTNQLPEPLNLNKSINELEKTVETIPRLKTQDK